MRWLVAMAILALGSLSCSGDAAKPAAEKPLAARPEAAAPAPKELADALTLDLGKGVTMKLVLVRAGKFLMGDPGDVRFLQSPSGPQHEVTISRPFYMGMTEVTQEQYETVMGTNLSLFKGAARPADTVAWNDALEFCARLSEKTGRAVRLPTEAEWEYACRAGVSSGDDPGGFNDQTWYGCVGGATHPVGQKKPNAWGLYDMHGNVWEWCSDWFGYYSNEAVTDPQGPPFGSYRVSRGGGWNDMGYLCSSTFRNTFGSSEWRVEYYFGFRVVAPASAGAGPAATAALAGTQTGAPVEFVPQMPRTIDEARQPFDAIVRNLAGAPVSGTLQVEVAGNSVRQVFGPIPAGSEGLVEAVVPNLTLPGGEWTVRYEAVVNGATVSAEQRLAGQRYWLVLGPFPNPPAPGFVDAKMGEMGAGPNTSNDAFNGSGYDYVFEPERGVDLSREYFLPKDLPMRNLFAARDRRVPLRWRTFATEAAGFVDLMRVCTPNTQAVAFVLTYARCPASRKAVLSVGSDDFIKVWVNGRQVIGVNRYRGAHQGSDRADVELKAGPNEILLKVGTGLGGWGFFCEILGPDGRPMDDIVYSLRSE